MNVQAFLEVLPLAGEGMLGVFATIIVLGSRALPCSIGLGKRRIHKTKELVFDGQKVLHICRECAKILETLALALVMLLGMFPTPALAAFVK